jgi:hypothetical protein
VGGAGVSLEIDPSVFGTPDPEPPDDPYDDDANPTRVSHLDGAPPVMSGGARGSTWRAVDLGPYLRGEIHRPEPTIGWPRRDGLRLLYPGKEHTVIGEMESGKSWFALACVVAELTKGNRVVYIHFEEADPADTIERLQALHVPDQVILERFTFVGPNEPVDQAALAVLLDPAPTLVVLDGVNEAMYLHRWLVNDTDGAAAYRRHLVKPCNAVGAAVLSADHVVKDQDKRGRNALGSIHKGNGITGSLISLENVAPFGRGEHGASHVFVMKDRPGHLRRHGRPTKLPGKTYVGTLIVDATYAEIDQLDLVFTEPPDDTTSRPTITQVDADDLQVLEAVGKVTAGGHLASLRAIRATVSGFRGTRVDDAVTRLVLAGTLNEHPGKRNARIFTVSQDQTEECVP